MKKILIADDETDVLNILKKRLDQNNYLVSIATTGKEALNSAKSIKPDLIILDIGMPDMDGYDIASELKHDESLENIPVIFITGKDLLPEGIEKRIAELGAYDYITKPCSFETILEKIHSIIG